MNLHLLLLGTLAILNGAFGWLPVALYCDETGMTLESNTTTANSIANTLNWADKDSDAVQRFRKSSHSTIDSTCGTGTGTLGNGTYSIRYDYSTCSSSAEYVQQLGDVIKRSIVVEVQPEGLSTLEVIRWLNYTKFTLECEYQREYNLTNDFNVTVSSNVKTETKTEQDKYALSMKFYDAGFASVNSADPIQVALNEEMRVSVEKDDNTDTSLKMVVRDCWATDTSGGTGTYTYNFWQAGACNDGSLSIHNVLDSKFQFKINSFVFIGLKTQTWLHCRATICLDSESSPECTLPSTSACKKRKRRGIEQAPTRWRRAASSSAVGYGEAVSSAIVMTKKDTCADITCPSNAECVENFPAFCRCKNDAVMSTLTGSCTTDNLVEMNIPTQLTWIQEYASATSQFTAVAKLYEEKMVELLIKKHSFGINGVKVQSASNSNGKLTFRVVMTLAAGVTEARVSQQIQAAVSQKESLPQVATSTRVEVIPIVVPVASTSSANGISSTTQNIILVVVGVLLVCGIFIIIAFRRRRNDKEDNKNVVVMTAKPNAAYEA